MSSSRWANREDWADFARELERENVCLQRELDEAVVINKHLFDCNTRLVVPGLAERQIEEVRQQLSAATAREAVLRDAIPKLESLSAAASGAESQEDWNKARSKWDEFNKVAAHALASDGSALIDAVREAREALKLLKHADGCYCEASFSGPDCHPRHSPECEKAKDALAKLDAALGGKS